MVNGTSSGTRIRAIPTNSHTISACHSNASPIRPLLVPSVTATATVNTPQDTPHLPPKTPPHLKDTLISAKKRKNLLAKIPCTQWCEGNSSCRNEKSSPMINHCSVAMSRTESIMVSSAGDVIVCRCRRSSTPFLPPKARDPLYVWDKQFPCCDTELLSSIDGPWSPSVLQSVTTNNKKGRDGSISQISTTTDFSTYEWEKNNNHATNNLLGVKGLRVGSHNTNQNKELSHCARNQKCDEQSNYMNQSLITTEDHTIQITDPEEREEESPIHNRHLDNEVGDDFILSLPSFDYSHIIDGHNDMVPQSESKKQGGEKGIRSIHDSKTRQQRNKETFIKPSITLESRTQNQIKRQTIPRKDSCPLLVNEQKFFHGVPLFLSTLSQVRITKVSANPLGAHVLMISREALLFTYGLNHRGQLGIGFQSEIKNNKRGFHTTPTLITPLLENGGKAVNCAAGVDHSLVVVSTGGRRLQKLQFNPDMADSQCRIESSPCSPHRTKFDSKHEQHIDSEEVGGGRIRFSEKSVQYHQVYGFGRNNYMKLGLVRPHFNERESEGDAADDVVLPRRVGLHCTVWPHEVSFDDNASLPSQGVFDIAASTEHSSALVRRATGDVEVYMWGNASLGALGLPLNIKSDDIKGEIARKPSSTEKKVSPLPTLLESLCYRRNTEPDSPFATKVSLGPYCSFIVLSNGKCMSCGFSAEGMLGHGYNTTFSVEPCEVFLPLSEFDRERSNRIVSVSAGAFHALALSEDGDVYSWGINSNERLGLGPFDYSSVALKIEGKKENLVVIEWVPQMIDINNNRDLFPIENISDGKNDAIDGKKCKMNRISLACAGYDSSFLVTESGKVLSFGKRSGRLGKGEISSNVNTPQPLYGGLHLFRKRASGKCPASLEKKQALRIRHRSVSAAALK